MPTVCENDCAVKAQQKTGQYVGVWMCGWADGGGAHGVGGRGWQGHHVGTSCGPIILLTPVRPSAEDKPCGVHDAPVVLAGRDLRQAGCGLCVGARAAGGCRPFSGLANGPIQPDRLLSTLCFHNPCNPSLTCTAVRPPRKGRASQHTRPSSHLRSVAQGAPARPGYMRGHSVPAELRTLRAG